MFQFLKDLKESFSFSHISKETGEFTNPETSELQSGDTCTFFSGTTEADFKSVSAMLKSKGLRLRLPFGSASGIPVYSKDSEKIPENQIGELVFVTSI